MLDTSTRCSRPPSLQRLSCPSLPIFEADHSSWSELCFLGCPCGAILSSSERFSGTCYSAVALQWTPPSQRCCVSDCLTLTAWDSEEDISSSSITALQLRGYELAHRRHGRLPWRELFQPSIQLAREGIRVSKGLAEAMQKNKEDIEANETLCEVFCDSNKTILRENDTIRFPRLADTYEKIAEGGPDVFYNGSMAETIVKDIKAAGPSLFNY
ncbi:hypothetical protein PGIGA_G00250730 [Pangasianodon gigas]|uniref:Uncharacterized protein n=1 Tax=Pangasianodon gigas TaxID=30993 RepID=A0ACC5WQF8_PANGG|nr:hypothetical protein [Pangasianodon gigas]